MALGTSKHKIVPFEYGDAIFEIVDDGLSDYNVETHPAIRGKDICLAVRDATSAVLGGIIAICRMEVVEVKQLWVSEEARGAGIGSVLMRELEQRAIAENAQLIHLDTYSFQAPEFYPKIGFEEFARLTYPNGAEKIFFQKKL